MKKYMYITTIVSILIALSIISPIAPLVLAEESAALKPITCPYVGGTLVVIHWGDPKSFNPDSQVDDALAAIAGQIFNRLVALDTEYNVIPDLAESWEVAPNGSVFIFHLRKDVKWHDGVPFTAKDVKYTFDSIKKYKGIAYSLLKMDKLVSVETPDNYTVIFRYSEPFPPFLGFLAWYGTYILPEHIYNKTEYQDWMDPNIPALTHPVGTGPFKFVEYVKGSHVVLEANPDYFKGKPCIDRVVFKIVPDATAALQTFLAGEGDVLNHRPPLSEIPRINATEGIMVKMRPVPSRWYIGFNLLKYPFNITEFRFAIAHAINRSEIVEKAEYGYGYPAEGMYTPAIKWAFNPNVKLPEYDPQKAEQLLDQLGFKKGSDGWRYYPNGTKITVRFTIFTGAEEEAIAQVIKEQLKRVGIDVKIEEYEIATWEAKVIQDRDFHLALVDGFQGPDPDNMRMRFGPGQYINFANYSNPEFGKLLEEASKEPDMEKRRELYWKAQEIMAKDLPYLPLVDLVAFYIYRTEWHNFPWELPGVVPYNSYERVYWEKGTPVTTTPTTTSTPTTTTTSPTTTKTTTSPAATTTVSGTVTVTVTTTAKQVTTTTVTSTVAATDWTLPVALLVVGLVIGVFVGMALKKRK